MAGKDKLTNLELLTPPAGGDYPMTLYIFLIWNIFSDLGPWGRLLMSSSFYRPSPPA